MTLAVAGWGQRSRRLRTLFPLAAVLPLARPLCCTIMVGRVKLLRRGFVFGLTRFLCRVLRSLPLRPPPSLTLRLETQGREMKERMGKQPQSLLQSAVEPLAALALPHNVGKAKLRMHFVLWVVWRGVRLPSARNLTLVGRRTPH